LLVFGHVSSCGIIVGQLEPQVPAPIRLVGLPRRRSAVIQPDQPIVTPISTFPFSHSLPIISAYPQSPNPFSSTLRPFSEVSPP